MQIETSSKKFRVNQSAIYFANCNIVAVANLCKIQNLAVCIIMQSAKIGRILIKILVKLQIWEGMGCRAFKMG